MPTVIVLGTLGDVVKKVCELELLAEDQHSRDTIVQLSAYYKILEQWPVEDKFKVERLCNSLKVQFAKHLEIEKELKEFFECNRNVHVTDDAFQMAQLAAKGIQVLGRHLESLNMLRGMINKLNEQGQHLGLPPISINIEEGSDESSTDVSPEQS